jgi:hypothetical protein
VGHIEGVQFRLPLVLFKEPQARQSQSQEKLDAFLIKDRSIKPGHNIGLSLGMR